MEYNGAEEKRAGDIAGDALRDESGSMEESMDANQGSLDLCTSPREAEASRTWNLDEACDDGIR